MKEISLKEFSRKPGQYMKDVGEKDDLLVMVHGKGAYIVSKYVVVEPKGQPLEKQLNELEDRHYLTGSLKDLRKEQENINNWRALGGIDEKDFKLYDKTKVYA